MEENAGDGVWDAWAVTYRDVIILDSNNVQVDVYNLTDNDLAEPDNYATLERKLLAIDP